MTRTLLVLCALAVGASADTALSAKGSIPLPRGRPDGIDATLSTEAQASAQANWTAAVVAHMRAQTEYPALARALGSEGVLQLYFIVDRKGAVDDVRILRSSGSLLLDGRSLRLLYAAQPFPLPPDELAGDRFPFTLPIPLPIRYRLQHDDTR